MPRGCILYVVSPKNHKIRLKKRWKIRLIFCCIIAIRSPRPTYYILIFAIRDLATEIILFVITFKNSNVFNTNLYNQPRHHTTNSTNFINISQNLIIIVFIFTPLLLTPFKEYLFSRWCLNSHTSFLFVSTILRRSSLPGEILNVFNKYLKQLHFW